MEQPIKDVAIFAVDCNGKLAIDHDGKSLALPAAEVMRLMEFLTSITYRGLVQRAEINAAQTRGAQS